MDLKSSLVPIMSDVVEKAMHAAGKDNPDEIKVVKEAVLNDKEVTAKIAALVKPEPKPLPAKPETFERLRSFVRPVITLMLAVVFVFLIVSPFLNTTFIHNLGTDWDKIFASFMGVFGTIIGFWFGERSALKVPGGEEAKEEAAEAREDIAKALGRAQRNNPNPQG